MRRLKILWTRKGLTLTEILIVVIIIGMLMTFSGIAFNRMHRLQDDLAKASLKLIFTEEKIYYLEEATYVAADNTSAVNDTLGLEIVDSFYTYSIAASSTSFTASAAKNNGSKTFTINETGTISEE